MFSLKFEKLHFFLDLAVRVIYTNLQVRFTFFLVSKSILHLLCVPPMFFFSSSFITLHHQSLFAYIRSEFHHAHAKKKKKNPSAFTYAVYVSSRIRTLSLYYIITSYYLIGGLTLNQNITLKSYQQISNQAFLKLAKWIVMKWEVDIFRLRDYLPLTKNVLSDLNCWHCL